MASRETPRAVLVLLYLASWAAWPVRIWSEEPVQAFLEALRQRGYYDQALLYLDRRQEASGTAPEARRELAYEQAVTAGDAAKRELDFAKKTKLLAVAQAKLETIVTEPLDPPLLVNVRRALLETHTHTALTLLARWKSQETSTDRNAIRDQAEQQFSSARKVARELSQQLRGLLEEMQKRPRSEQNVTLRDQWRAEYIAALTAEPSCLFASAELVGHDLPEQRKRLKEAADAYDGLAETYSRYPQRYLSLLISQGRCLLALKEYPDAIARFSEVLETEGLPAAISGAATRYLMECRLVQSPEQASQVVELGEEWIKQYPRESPSDTAPVRLALAQALAAIAETTQGRAADQAVGRARRLLRQLVQERTAESPEAQTLLGKLRGGTEPELDLQSLSTFSDARMEADSAVAHAQASERNLQILTSQLADLTDEARKIELQKELTTLQEEIQKMRSEAASYYRRALSLANRDVSVDDLNHVRFLLAWLCYQEGAYFDSAVIAEFLARHYGDSPNARAAARTAMGAYYRIYESGEANPEFASGRLIDIARYMAHRWPNDQEGQTAMLTLVRFLVSRGRLDDAREYVMKLPEDSPFRAEAQLTTGAALFREYQSTISERRKSSSAISTSDLQQLKNAAQEMLEQGLKSTEELSPSTSSIVARLSLARMRLLDGMTQQALDLLNDPKHGPYSLIQAKDPSVAGLAEEIYRTTLQAYFSHLMSGKDGSAPESRIQSVMESLSKELGDTAEGNQRLLAIYIGLAKDLGDQFAAVPPAEQGAAADSFATLLDRVAATANDPRVLNWVGHTLQELADIFSQPGHESLDRKSRFLQSAANVLLKVLDSDQGRTDATLQTQTQMRLASVQRRQGEFPAAIESFQQVLATNPNLLNVQIEAAYTYQEGKAYRYAIKGGRPDRTSKQNVIWGWEKISVVVARQIRSHPESKPQYYSVFHEARFNIALARFLEAQLITSDKRKEYLQQARQAILSISGLYPDLGGEQWKPKYEELLQQIDAALGQET